MANRLTKITTRTGDDGSTGLAGGQRLSKAAPRIQVLGDVDELNSCIGVVLAENPPPEISEILAELQQGLFDLGAELSVPDATFIQDRHVLAVESATQRFNADLPPLREFILPGGGRAAALCHLARTVCRRAERSLVALGDRETVGEPARRFLNRISDLLFVLARMLGRSPGRAESAWRGPPPRG